MPHFPMFIDLKNKPVLVVGGGKVALRKLQKLAPYGPKITVVAPDVVPEVEEVCQASGAGAGESVCAGDCASAGGSDFAGISLCRREFHEDDLNFYPELVIAATNNVEVNHKIAALCKEKRIPVNVVDDPAACTFIFPALVQQGNFSAGISTGGASPTAAVHFKECLQDMVPENLDEILSWLEAQRPLLKSSIPEQSKRAGVFRRLFDACMKKGAPLTEAEMEEYISVKKVGCVALVGASCGKADLITVRGLKLLQQCEAVVYDDLIDPALLEAVPESAERIYMGKRSGAHSAPQHEINAKLVELGKAGLQVVRLKGGDPYLFGRGGEEMLALIEAGVPCFEVPGIPSAIGIPAEAGIPVTHRGASRGLHIITAHTSDTADYLPADFDHFAKLEGTLVFLMGLKQLPRIAERLVAAGKSKDTPAAVLSGGNSKNPARVRATLETIVQAADEAKVSSPAIIMVGDVAALDLTFEAEAGVGASAEMSGASANIDALHSVRVGVTGTKEVVAKQETLFQALGAKTEWVARSIVTERKIDLDLDAMDEKTCWIVFTSSNGVKTFFRQMAEQNVNLEVLKKHKFAVIGAATGETLEKYGIHADLCPEKFTSEALAYDLAEAAKQGEEIILLRSSIGSPILPKVLKETGHVVHDVSIYDLETADAGAADLPELDYLTFSSASGVELFFKMYGAVPEGVKCVCIGEVTAKALSAHTDEAFLMAEEISAEGIVKAVVADRK